MSKTHLSGRNTPTCSAHWKVHRRAGTSPYTVTFQDIKSQSNYLPLTSNNLTKKSQNNSIYKGIKNQHQGRSLAYTPTKTQYQKTCKTPETHTLPCPWIRHGLVQTPVLVKATCRFHTIPSTSQRSFWQTSKSPS